MILAQFEIPVQPESTRYGLTGLDVAGDSHRTLDWLSADHHGACPKPRTHDVRRLCERQPGRGMREGA